MSGSRGISIIWVVFAVTLAAGAAITAEYQYLECQTTTELIKKAEDAKTAAERDRKFVVFPQIKAICRLAGWPFDQEGQIEATLTQIKDRIDLRKGTTTPGGYNLPGKSMALFEIVHSAEIRYDQAWYRLETANTSKALAAAAAETSRQTLANYGTIKDAEIAELKEALKTLDALKTDDFRRFGARKTALEDQDGKLVKAKADLEKTQRDEMTKLGNDINRLTQQLHELVKQEAVVHDLTEAQGVVIDPNLDEKFAFVDLGAGDRLVRGLKFMVFVRESGGNIRWKGEVEVKDIYDRQAKVSITDTVDMLDPIIESDLIYNPLFSKTRPRHVVLVGDFAKTRYTKDQAIARIRNIGCVVDDAVNDMTDFIIVGESYQTEANYEAATTLSVPVRPAFEIFEFLGD